MGGTKAYTLDGVDEKDEYLEIVSEGGVETLNGWCLLSGVYGGNMLIWEDNESYDRVVWIRAGHNLEGALEHMEEVFTINLLDSSTGSLVCEVIAEKTWLISDLMEAVEDMVGLHPREQKLVYQGFPLARQDEPLIDIIPGTAGE